MSDRMIEKYPREDQEKIVKEIEEIKDILNKDILDLQIVALIIHFYFKHRKI